MARLLIACLWVVSARPPLPVPEFTINLDTDPEHRFDEVIGHFNDTIQLLVQKYATPAILDIAKQFAKHRGEENAELQGEIRGIAREVGVPEYAIQTVSFLYELQTLMVPLENISWPWAEGTPVPDELRKSNVASAFGGFGCTGIIIRDEDGSVHHGRNLDFSFAKYLQNMTYMGTFTKGGKELFTVQMVAAYPMLLTGIRRGSNGYTIEINTRYLDHWGGNKDLLNNIFSGRESSGWVKRKILEEIDNYEDAVEAFASRPYIGTEYNIISGVKKGVILGRNPDSAAYRIYLNETDRYIIMTNFDYIYGDVKEYFDPTSPMGIGHSRRKGAMKLLKKNPQLSFPEGLLDLMADDEVIAKDTIFQAVFNVEKDTVATRLPFCKSCDGCLDVNECVSSQESCCSERSHFTARCATHSVKHQFRCGCLLDGECREARPGLNASKGVEDCCSLEDHFTLACPGTRRCGKDPSLESSSENFV